jgi:hypothetical protein
MRAINVRGLRPDTLSWDRIAQGIRPDECPTRIVDDPFSRVHDAAVVSWRWDRHPESGRSRNLALALRLAQEAGIDLVFVDLVSIDQTLPKDRLLRAVVSLANLFASIPVIAAYDEETATMREWSSVLRRPWILSEIKAYCQNPTSVTYVGYRHGPTQRRDLSFANEVSVLRSEGYADTIFEVLCGRVRMTDSADFAEILAEFHEAVAACHKAFARPDYLFAVFLLTAAYERRQVVVRDGAHLDYGFRLNVDNPQLDEIGLERFRLGPYMSNVAMYESARSVLLDGSEIAVWRSKMTSSYDRNWIDVLPHAEDAILDAAGLSLEARVDYRGTSELRTAFLRLDRDAPTPLIGERAASLEEGRWLDEIPEPSGVTLGFNPDLWRRS